jgi:hypothetical protein
MRRIFQSRFVAVIGALMLAGMQAPAQTTFATITGAVRDSTGARVPGVKITATNLETNVKAGAAANEVGVYTVPQLKEGTYSLVVEAAGFAEFKAENIVLAARDVRRVDIVLTVGQVATVIEVTAGATLIETETARISSTQGATALKTLPLNARWMWAFLNLSPNFISGPEGYRFGGARQSQANWSIDGTTFNDGDGGSLGPQANYVESFQEVKIDVGNNSAEFGGVGQLTVITKSGANQVHGAAFDYYTTPFFRARNPFALQRATGVSHLYGGAFSGPVYLPKLYNGKNKTFFYTSLESSTGGSNTTFLNPTVPLQLWRSGDFSREAVINDPTNNQPFANNRIPASRINPVAQKLQDRFYPLPNYGDTSILQTANYREYKTRGWDPSTYWMVRGDHHFSEKDIVYGRFTFTRGPNRPYEGNLPTIGQRVQRRDTRSASVSYTHTFRPDLVNEFRWGMSLNNNPFQGPIRGLEQVKELGLQGLAPDLPDLGGMLKVSFTGLGVQGLSQIDYSNGYRNHPEEFQEHLTWLRGRHSLKFGFDLVRLEIDDVSAPAALYGSASFSNRYTGAGRSGQGHAYADFLLGIPTQSSRAFMPPRVERNRWQYDFFVTDDFKVTRRLTLSLGLRYELHLPWRENSNRVSMFDIGTSGIIVPDGSLALVSPLFPKGYVGITEASKAGFRNRTLIFPDRNNFAPRVGLAYRPWDAKTVLRAGYGIFFDPVPPLASVGGSPFNIGEPAYPNPTTGYIVLPTVYPAATAGSVSSVGVGSAINPNIRVPYSMQYNFTIEREVWDTGLSLRYLGTNTRQGVWAYNYNSPVPDTRLFVDKPRPFMQYPAINYRTNGAGHQYNAFTVEAKRPMSKGLHLNTHWTWARDIYDLDDGESPENPFDRRRERAVARSIPTHRWVTNAIYQLPVGNGRRWMRNANRWANLAVGGWDYSVIYTASTGRFFSASYTGPDTTGTAYTASRTPLQVARRPDILHNPNLPSSERTVKRYFDTSAFAPARPGQFGTSAKNVIKGPGINCFNMGLHKNFEINEQVRLRWEMTAINIFNHPNWGPPNFNLSSGVNFGVITGVGGSYDSTGARVFRMALRMEW